MAGHCGNFGGVLQAGRLGYAKRGFTLLEVLLATVLMSALLLTLWSLIGTYTALFATGQARTEQSQIARSLLQQISDDLAGAIQDTAARPRLEGAPPSGLPPADAGKQIGAGLPSSADANSSAVSTDNSNGGSTAVRRFGLFGSLHELRLDVLQTAAAEVGIAAARSDVDEAEMVSNQFDVDKKTPCRVPELRTVYYKFKQPRAAEKEESTTTQTTTQEDKGSLREETPAGLIREEIDFETRNPAGLLASDEDADSLGESDTLANDAESSETEKKIEDRLDDGSLLLAPEVVGMEFRYFDGSVWTSQWDSIAKESLPVAVEVRMQIESLDPRAVRRRAAEELQAEKVEYVGGEGAEEDVTSEELGLEAEKRSRESEEAEDSPAEIETYRLIIELPTARLQKGVQKTASRTEEPPRPPQPLTTQPLDQTILPPPLPEKSKQDENAPQRWLRSDR